jgi:hypothetical protein
MIWMARIQFLAGARDFSLLSVHLASYPVSTGSSFPGEKVAGS